MKADKTSLFAAWYLPTMAKVAKKASPTDPFRTGPKMRSELESAFNVESFTGAAADVLAVHVASACHECECMLVLAC